MNAAGGMKSQGSETQAQAYSLMPGREEEEGDEDKEDVDVVTGTIPLFGKLASTLFDSGATHSFISSTYVKLCSITTKPLNQNITVSVSIIGLILFGQNHLYVKDVVLQGIPLFRRVSEDSACKTENLRFPVSCPNNRAIPSGRPSVHYSIHPDDEPYRPDARQTKHHPSKRLSSPSGHLSVIDQLQILSKFNLREDCFNRPDDVDSRPDALIHKERSQFKYHSPNDSRRWSGRAFIS
jgi:hypothetical protein